MCLLASNTNTQFKQFLPSILHKEERGDIFHYSTLYKHLSSTAQRSKPLVNLCRHTDRWTHLITLPLRMYKSSLCKCKNICIKLKGEVGMAVPKSNRTRVVRIITYMVHPYACFSHYGAIKVMYTCVHQFIDLQG